MLLDSGSRTQSKHNVLSAWDTGFPLGPALQPAGPRIEGDDVTWLSQPLDGWQRSSMRHNYTELTLTKCF